MRLIATDLISGLEIELYPRGPLKSTMDSMIDESMVEKPNATVREVNLPDGTLLGILSIGPKKENKRNVRIKKKK